MIYVLMFSLAVAAISSIAVVVQVHRHRAEREAAGARVSNLVPSPTRRWVPPSNTPTAPNAR